MRLLEKEKKVAKNSVSLLLLDTACMLQVLLCEELNVKNECTLLQFVAHWASQLGSLPDSLHQSA